MKCKMHSQLIFFSSKLSLFKTKCQRQKPCSQYKNKMLKKIGLILGIFACTTFTALGRINEPVRVNSLSSSRRLVKTVDTKAYLKESLEMVAPRRSFWKSLVESFTRASSLRSFEETDLNW